MAQAISRLTEAVLKNGKDQEEGFRAVKVDMEIMSGRHNSLEVKIDGVLEWRDTMIDWKETVVSRLQRNSFRAQSGSLTDIEIIDKQKKLEDDVASIKVKTKAIEEETSLQTTMIREGFEKVGKFVATPVVKVVGGIILGIISHWLYQKFGITLHLPGSE